MIKYLQNFHNKNYNLRYNSIDAIDLIVTNSIPGQRVYE